MDAPFFLVPGEQIMSFTVKRKDSTATNGRVVYDAVKIGSIEGTISEASQKEKYEWKQMDHPITNTIVVRGTCNVIAEDILVDEQYQNYHVQGATDPSALGFFTIIYCKRVRWSNDDENQNPDIP
ncbi:hypothetical protein [Acetobacterium tundrae]|uniref:Uncharacterized protein n=1 Tax=Acetobacterium tundrae TaxID=132932 RepID=A0ABR6WNF0_9FIRM|nr:hypothetical protein [Acetobacterium tundrae]MBC3798032.1 hypothetical protein [Acetobacterium tundrae]